MKKGWIIQPFCIILGKRNMRLVNGHTLSEGKSGCAKWVPDT